MEADKIINADLLDIIFENKNKAYGAYELRKTYNHRITIGMIGMALICLLFFLNHIFGNDNGKARSTMKVTDVNLKSLAKTKEKKVEIPPVKLPKTETKVEIKRFTPPVITPDDKVTDPPPAVESLNNVKIGANNQQGAADDGFVAPLVEQSTGAVEGPKKEVEDYEKVFIRVEKEAKFPGGMEGWKRYLERNLNANVAADDGAGAGNYTVKVQFIVDKEGSISKVQAIEVPKACPSCGPEAVKVIKNGPKWEPAIQNDRKVNYQAVQFVTFQVANE